MTTNNELVLKPINELLNESFYIPSYQRGYRWTRRQVTELLDDISEFQQQSEDSAKSAFYCLQPVVVKKIGDEWELVDGQQRLTTIHIILSFLKDIVIMLGKTPYNVRYETRPDSAEFLKSLDESAHQNNIDFFHMYEAYQAVKDWFDERDANYKLKFFQTLLNDDATGKNVKVIWYQINENIDATSVFTRLNLGKIPLTNAELVKALFLKANNFNKGEVDLARLKIAQEWDEIERTLQSDEFWFFLQNKPAEANRIEFILRLVANGIELDENSIPERDSFYIFLVFSKWLTVLETSINSHWEDVKRHFMVLREWFEDRETFHLVGFLVARETSIEELIKLFAKCSTKKEFTRSLVVKIYKKVFYDLSILKEDGNKVLLKDALSEYFTDLSYNSARQQVISALLLFNIASLLDNKHTNIRFEFDRFKKESWDVEHIRSVASEMPESKERQKIWLKGVVEYLSDERNQSTSQYPENLSSELVDEIIEDSNRVLNGKRFDSDTFKSIFDLIVSHYVPEGNDETDHSLGNLTLLDSSTNRSYQNAIFPIKRNRIISLDKTATFVPVCTKNAFLKYYSEHVDNMMFWQTSDSKAHEEAMIDVIVSFFSAEGIEL